MQLKFRAGEGLERPEGIRFQQLVGHLEQIQSFLLAFFAFIQEP